MGGRGSSSSREVMQYDERGQVTVFVKWRGSSPQKNLNVLVSRLLKVRMPVPAVSVLSYSLKLLTRYLSLSLSLSLSFFSLLPSLRTRFFTVMLQPLKNQHRSMFASLWIVHPLEQRKKMSSLNQLSSFINISPQQICPV